MLEKEMTVSIIQAIVKQQSTVIGPIAIEQANKVSGLVISSSLEVIIDDKVEKMNLIDQLVQQYELLFGQTSVNMCKDAIRELHLSIPSEDLPESLK